MWLFCLFAFAVQAAPAPAEEVAQVKLVADQTPIEPNTPFYVGVRFDLAPTWHVYWKNPGDSGAPPEVEWTLPNGWTAGPLLYPTPKVFESASLIGYGYSGSVTYLTRITPTDTTTGTIEADIDYLVCDDAVCLPGSAEGSLTLPAEAADVVDLGTVLAALPEPMNAEAASRLGMMTTGAATHLELTEPNQITLQRRGGAFPRIVTFIPEAVAGLVVESVDVEPLGSRSEVVRITHRTFAGSEPPKMLPGLLVIETSADQQQAYETAVPLAAAPAEAEADTVAE